MKTILCTLLLLLSLFLVSPAQTANGNHASDDPFSGVRAFIRKQMIERQVPSVAVAVSRDGKILWEGAFGWADREKRVPATPHTIYSLASISKPITATGLMILKERGKVDLDRPIADYLGEAKINVRGILDYVIERVSGKNYAEFMRTEVFQALGLTHMSVDIGPGLEKDQAIRYGADGLPIPFYAFDHPGGSAVYASAHDLLRFGMFHLKSRLPDQKPILSDQTIDEMQKPTMEIGDGQGYGAGWNISTYPGNHLCVSHSGGMGGVSTSLRLFPAEKIAVVVLTNSSSPAPHLIADEIVATLMPDARRKESAQNRQVEETVFKPASELIGTWKGTVHT
jgi:CubicO group peptidase (beta-lactamase class C family)